MGQAQGQPARSARCIALVGPYLSGKTTLLEAILARTGDSYRLDGHKGVVMHAGAADMLMQEVLSRHASHAGLTGSPATAVQDAVRRNWRVPQPSACSAWDSRTCTCTVGMDRRD